MTAFGTGGMGAAAGEADGAGRPPVMRWDAKKRDCFNALKPAALILVATDGPVSVTLWQPGGSTPKRRFGHNRGIWPAKLVRSGARHDTATQTYDKNPFFFVGAQFRLWFLTGAHRDRAAQSVVDMIASRSEDGGGVEALGHGFQDLGPELDLAFFEMEVAEVCRRAAGPCWDDDGLSRFLDAVLAETEALRRTGKLRARTEEWAWEAVATGLAGAGR